MQKGNKIITFKYWKQDGSVKLYHSSKTRRIISRVKADKFTKAYIKVVYGAYKNNYGTTSLFYNEGVYETKADLLYALHAFTEQDKVNSDIVLRG